MLKKLSLIIITLISMLTLSVCFADEVRINYDYPKKSSEHELIIEDDAGLFDTEELDMLRNVMAPLTEFGGIALKTTSNNPLTPKEYAENFFYSKFDDHDDATLFLIDMQHRWLQIYSDGRNYRIITNSKADIITDNVFRYASKGDYYTCAEQAFKQMYTLLNGGKISEPMRYISSALVSLVLGFLACFIFIMSKSKTKKANVKDIVSNCNVKFLVNNVTGIKTGERRVYNPPSSSSGGSRSSRRRRRSLWRWRRSWILTII